MKPLAELIEVDDPAVEGIRKWVDASEREVVLGSPARESSELSLERIGVSRRSTLGGVIFDLGSIVVDGWLRILGSDFSDRSRSIDLWNGIPSPGRPPQRVPGILLIADDIVGGLYAISDGKLASAKRGTICYYSPGALEWISMRVGYTAFVSWVLTGSFPKWRDKYTWDGWRGEAVQIGFDEALSVYPFLFSAGRPIKDRSRRRVPVGELFSLYVNELPAQVRRKAGSDGSGGSA